MHLTWNWLWLECMAQEASKKHNNVARHASGIIMNRSTLGAQILEIILTEMQAM
jgi:hypothetical protein